MTLAPTPHVDRRPAHQRPFAWWGERGRIGQRRTLDSLVDPATASWLSERMRLSPNVIVAAGAGAVGKTTLLTALLEHLPPFEPIYLRGTFERFDFLSITSPRTSYLLANEISPHLPEYLWGDAARRTFTLLDAGYRLAATMHATSAAEVLASLTRSPLFIPTVQLDLVITLAPGHTIAAIERIDHDGSITQLR